MNRTDIERLLRDHGYAFGRRTGSHEHWYHVTSGRRITFALNRGQHALSPPNAANLRARLERNDGRRSAG